MPGYTFRRLRIVARRPSVGAACSSGRIGIRNIFGTGEADSSSTVPVRKSKQLKTERAKNINKYVNSERKDEKVPDF